MNIMAYETILYEKDDQDKFAILTINSHNRLAVAFRRVPGS